MFIVKRTLIYILVYIQVFTPLDVYIQTIINSIGVAEVYAGTTDPPVIQNPICDKRCYDARTDNPASSYLHDIGTSPQTKSFDIKKGITFGIGTKARAQDGCYIKGDKLNVCQVGDIVAVRFTHPDGNTYGIDLKAKKNTWVAISVSINPNFIAGTSRNADTGEYDEKVYELGYKPVDDDDPTKKYTINITTGNLSDGLYLVDFDLPYPMGVKPFCSEEIAFCTYQWVDVTVGSYNTDPNSERKNFSVGWWGAGDKGGLTSCDWSVNGTSTYTCDMNRGDLFPNVAGQPPNDGAIGLWGRRVVNKNGGEVLSERFGVFQKATQNNITEIWGMELDESSILWKKVGVQRNSNDIGNLGANTSFLWGRYGKFLLGSPPALSPLTISSDWQPTWVSYTFSNNWFWRDVGAPNLSYSCSAADEAKLEDGCWKKRYPLCPAGQVSLHPLYDNCYTYTGNAGCFDGQVQYNNQCWLKQGTPYICPSDGYSYVLKTPPTANYICEATATPSCPSGATKLGGNCYFTTPPSCPSGQIQYNGYCYNVTDPSCPAGQYIKDGSCYTAFLCSSGLCFLPLFSSNSSCPTDQIISNTYACCQSYSYWSYGGLCFYASYSTTSCPSGYSTSSPICFTWQSYACPPGYIWQNTGPYIGKCMGSAGSACPSGYWYDWSSGQCLSYYGSACSAGFTYDSSRDLCVRQVEASCPAGQTKIIDPSTGYYACYVLDLNHGKPPGSIYCRVSTDIQYNNRCYRYASPLCQGYYTPELVILASANSYGEWTGACWGKVHDFCPSGSLMRRGEYVTATRCLAPRLEFSKRFDPPLSNVTFGQELCNAIALAKSPTNYAPCYNPLGTSGIGPNKEVVFVGTGEQMNAICPLNSSTSCVHITRYVAMCGTDKNCASCYPSNIEGKTYDYVEIDRIQKLSSGLWTGVYKFEYSYPVAKEKISSVNGRLPNESESSQIVSLWGLAPDSFWTDGNKPVACASETSAQCLGIKKKVVVVWDNPSDAGFYAECVYSSTGDAVCTGDAVECNNGVCPLNPAYPCVDWNGKKVCSTTKCKSAASPDAGETEDVVLDENVLQNDGQRDEDGNCLGTIYLFTGKPSRCRPPGAKVGLLMNCCKETDSVMTDSLGSAVDLYKYYSAVKGIYDFAQVGWTAYQMGSKLSLLPLGTEVAWSGSTVSVVTPGGLELFSTTLSSPEAAYAVFRGLNVVPLESMTVGSEAGALAADVALSNYATNVLKSSLTTLAIAIAVQLVLDLLLGGCDAGDVQTNIMRDSKMCHFVGNYCEKKWPIIGCVQKAKSYCCFNSKLGRIVHEQGRPQLKAFGPDGGWGDPKGPNCRGFLPEEFQMLDFSKMDLSEYFEDLQREMDQRLQDMESNFNKKVEDFYNNVAE